MSPATQTYAPYRKTLLSDADLRELNILRPKRVMRDTIWLWAQIIAAWALVAQWPQWGTVLLALPVIGTRFYSLFIIGHDGLHRRLFESRRVNDAWNDIFVMGAIGAITRINRENHMRHHMTLGLPDDPDRYKYQADDKLSPMSYIFTLTGIRYVARALMNVFIPRRNSENMPRVRYTPRDFAILLCWQIALVGGLTWAIGWWAYPALWLLPVYVFTFTADIVRVFLEHSYPEEDARSDRRRRLVSFTSTPLERKFFAPLNMNFHAAHHLWPSIPYYNLALADARMRNSHNIGDGIVWRESYLAYAITFPGAARASRL
jgi:fatty acid desaturase